MIPVARIVATERRVLLHVHVVLLHVDIVAAVAAIHIAIAAHDAVVLIVAVAGVADTTTSLSFITIFVVASGVMIIVAFTSVNKLVASYFIIHQTLTIIWLKMAVIDRSVVIIAFSSVISLISKRCTPTSLLECYVHRH